MALKGIKVLEFAGLAPGPFCGMILADFGATVLRIDKVNNNTNLDVLSNGKQSLAVNLKSPEGIDIIKQLSKEYDVLIEPFRAGVMESLGIGPKILLENNPKLIYARLTGFGQDGPYSKRAGHDINYIGLSGLLSMFSRVNEKPMFPANLAADFGGGGLMCAMGILMALYERTNSGLGQIVDCNMVEGSSYLGSWLFRSQKLPIWGNKPGENVLDSGAHFYEVYETKDGKYVTVGPLEMQFYKELLDGLELEELDYFDFKNGKEVLTKIFLTKTRDEWSKIFDEKDACVFPVLTAEEATEHKHTKCNFMKDETTVIPKPGVKLSRTPAKTTAFKKSPQCGEDSIDVLKDLGYSEENIWNLCKKGIIKTHNSKL